MKPFAISLAAVSLLGLVASQTLTVFVVPPIGALPEGRTIVIPRGNGMRFLDSPDGMCLRIQGGVSLLCRGMVLARMGSDETRILLRLPYSGFLYRRTTGGREFSR